MKITLYERDGMLIFQKTEHDFRINMIMYVQSPLTLRDNLFNRLLPRVNKNVKTVIVFFYFHNYYLLLLGTRTKAKILTRLLQYRFNNAII